VFTGVLIIVVVVVVIIKMRFLYPGSFELFVQFWYTSLFVGLFEVLLLCLGDETLIADEVPFPEFL
jgi:hypothetical protein